MSEVVEIRPRLEESVRPYQERDGFAQNIVRLAGAMASTFPNDCHGVVIIGVDNEGRWSIGWRVREDSPIGVTALAGVGIAAISKDMLMEPTLKEALIRNGLVRDEP